MKKLLLLFCGLFILMNGYSQEKESKMKYVYSMDEAIQKASKENKLIFFNCYADWVVTCHSMDKLVFSDQKFADFMDQNFVNLFIDVALRENRDLADKYKIDFFAHYLILDANGEVVHRIVGGAKLPQFQEEIALALNPKTSLRGMNARYKKGENSVKFYRDYLHVLTMADENVKRDSLLTQFLSKINKKDWAKVENWEVIRRKFRAKDSEYFQYLIENKKDFVKNIGAKEINELISGIYINDIFKYATGAIEVGSTTIADFRILLNKANLAEDDWCYKVLDIAKMRSEKRYSDMIKSLKTDFVGGDNVMIDNLNYSFERIRDLSAAQKAETIEYLSSFLSKRYGSSLRQYNKVIAQVTEFVGIDFFQGTFAEAMALAKKEDKLIFMDAYTSWCGPCKMMASEVFSRKDVGELFNKTFINIKVDMERGEGLQLAEQYAVKSYPTMLLIDGDGAMVHRIVGGSDAKSFMERILRGTVKETSYAYLVNNFETIKENGELYINYLMAKDGALEITDLDKQLTDYIFKMKDLTSLAAPATMALIFERVKDYRNPAILKIIENSKPIKAKLGDEAYAKSLERFFFPILIQCVKGESSKEVYNEVKALISKANVPNSIMTHAVQILDLNFKAENDKVIAYYENKISKIADSKDKLNLDLLIKHLAKSFSGTQLEKIKSYVKESDAKAEAKAKNGYKSLLESL